jgi:hypothetical protein
VRVHKKDRRTLMIQPSKQGVGFQDRILPSAPDIQKRWKSAP